ncbi:MAG: TonB-dependent receptor plug domain-containing protein [Leadbetterella sp.]|jgi:iron complex outermembrane receptor protein|nr:TonB-dependent receptor plug domain-containing protein [Leadbetterella sp.]
MGKAYSKIIGYAFLFLSFLDVYSQADSTILLDETVVKGFETNQSILKTGASVNKISFKDIERFGNTNPVEVLNAQAGVRLEERSPGSYRIAIRGSSLRSPFGVRNVKVYWNNIPISDGNGQSYFNQLDINSIGNIEILKGPSGSIYGAGIGGVISLQTKNALPGHHISSGIHVGSFGTRNTLISYQNGSSKNNLFLNFSSNISEGYRDHSALDRKTLNLSNTFFLAKHTISLFGLLSDIDYLTPGGLTLAQMEANRKAARPKTPATPGAAEQKAGIRQKIGVFGVSDEWDLKNNWALNSAIFFTTNNLENPFITNFEERKEHTEGYRLVLSKKFNQARLWLGTEGLQTFSIFDVFDNNFGEKAAARYTDEIGSSQNSIFLQGQWTLPNDFVLTSGISFNAQNYDFLRIPILASISKIDISDKPVVPFSPRISLLKSFGDKNSIFINFSNGFSSPTAQELVSSVQNSPNFELLKAEKGLNKELGYKHVSTGFWNSELVFFQQNIKNGLVRNLTSGGNEYFLNTGAILQNGIEFSNHFGLVRSNTSKFIKAANLGLNLVYNDFVYKTFKSGTNDFSNKELPGVSKYNGFLKLDIIQQKGFFINYDMNYLSKMPLNDANTVFSEDVILSQIRGGFSQNFGKVGLKVYVGIDNLFEEDYSSGYDFNAFGNRFYNPSPPRNFNGGVKLDFRF